MASQQPLSTLVQTPEVNVYPAGAAYPAGVTYPATTQYVANGSGHSGWSWGTFILWFIIIAVLIWLVLYSLKPAWVLNPGTSMVNAGKVLLWSIIISLIIIFIIWLFKSLFSGCNSGAQGVAVRAPVTVY